ncbi:hypothetical protein EUGRSUZ_G00328 [Eucalyptus grandis]|uniref:Uncharacterized protein n=2 Tax=Eucalyptus grandis TaxID=71139 RepID=A0ACC3K183_EUCGR|nr:hypothetical protein EUGRSUZ_G00328 [Eucalyptus grandis]
MWWLSSFSYYFTFYFSLIMGFGVFFFFFFFSVPTLDVVVYNGSEDARRHSKDLQFYEEGTSIAFRVLRSPLEATVEAIDIPTQV